MKKISTAIASMGIIAGTYPLADSGYTEYRQRARGRCPTGGAAPNS